MANEVTSAGSATGASANAPNAAASPAGKGKGKFVQEDVADDDDDDDEEEEEEDEEMEEEEEDDLEEIDPSVIIGSRRTRGVRVDYTSAAALEKAGLKPEDADDEEGEESFVAKDTEMQED
ncbi:hypothetical protein FOMPIDRAFT_1027843 [Fomitopsis schrenkii]|uniref:Histone chaperone domain-containing protein n=1 Tax=Fomitopsis schrenkii TaxID=2126942 RepID=S8FTR7_FOMSC|nr:hypothetical protein FOMPIDRAFT_1027843 [Fomitopsis schrenkii]